jgi:hypothetical protein
MLVPDFESYLLLSNKHVLSALPLERDKIEKRIRDRAEMVRAGVMRCPSWFQEELNRLDSRSRAWWDAWREEWVLDRLQDEGYYLTFLHFQPRPGFELDRKLIEMLRSNDMQTKTPGEHIKDKEDVARDNQRANEQASTDRVMAAVDKMSSKQIRQFIDVEQAIASGDTITPHGSDLKFLETADAAHQQALREGEVTQDARVNDWKQAINPGMAPRIQRPERKEVPA